MGEEFRIDEADQNDKDERTWGVTTPSGYLVVTESKDNKSLRVDVIFGTAGTAEMEGAKELVKLRRRKDKLTTRVELCKHLETTSQSNEQGLARTRNGPRQ